MSSICLFELLSVIRLMRHILIANSLLTASNTWAYSCSEQSAKLLETVSKRQNDTVLYTFR